MSTNSRRIPNINKMLSKEKKIISLATQIPRVFLFCSILNENCQPLSAPFKMKPKINVPLHRLKCA